MSEPTPTTPGPASPDPTTEPTEPTTAPAPAPADRASRRARREDDPLRGSRTSGVWFGVIIAAIVLILLVIFIVQNTQSVRVSYFGWDGEAPLSVSLLVAAVAGMVLAIIAASLRILQLRRRVRRNRS
ncbi:LapA family protein [Nocardioides pantholopis]|uniref:LapA family protein n=1 Tax=Nocardioides pantholopis TaxID=2483798 RepID=UPI000F075FED|nr:lipopolysaccharide assembly protein LapA domain-containing protein [Nocardioides pantholopis]